VQDRDEPQAANPATQDADALSAIALNLMRVGRANDAAATLRRALRAAGPRPDLLFNLGIVEEGRGLAAEAERAWREALESEPAHRRARLRLAVLCERQGRLAEATAEWEAAYAVEPVDPAAAVGLARVRLAGGDARGACVVLEPLLPRAESAYLPILLSRAREALGDDPGALDALHHATAAFPGDDMAWRALGQLEKRLGRLEEAIRSFDRAHALLRAPASSYGLERPEFRHATRAKLWHDIEQLDWLDARGIRVPGGAEARAALARLLAAVPESLPDGESFAVPPALRARVAPWYNRCLHRAAAPRLAGGALNPALDWGALEAAYFATGPGLVVVDDFLRAEALANLRSFCLESTFWYDAAHANGYVGAYVHDGFAAPLLAQIAAEFRARMPQIFAAHALLQLWAYHYDSRLAGIEMHADFAAVNVNFWLTPDEANLDPESGGMIIWDREAPADWTAADYNRTDPEAKRAIREWLEAEGAKGTRIAHRQNRVVIFNSDLFHRTDDVRFRPGYGNRRLNVTMLYGWR
jgi:Flp pilus assembly protein TadD